MLKDKNIPKTPISEIGKLGLIHRISSAVKLKNKQSIKGIGDDAAVLEFKNKETLISTKLLTEGIHFDLGYVPLKHLGYKAVSSSISNIVAMNAIPKQILISIAVSDRFPVEAVDEIYAGALIACSRYNVDLVGGDITSSKSGLVLNTTTLGEAEKEEVVYRKGSNKTDLLVTTGDLGGAYFGLQILERENQVWKVNPETQPDLSAYDYIIGRQLKPEARVDIINLLSKLEVKPTAMTDVSNGLASAILHLSEQSEVGFTVYEEKIPLDQQVISAGEEFNINASIAALNGGEDYELLFTIPLENHDKIKGNPNFTVIGFANEKEEGNHLIGRGNTSKTPITSQDWEAFGHYKTEITKNK